MNGAPVRDRDERLQKLFLETPATAAAEARRITDESARFNLGRIRRNINVPTLPLELLWRVGEIPRPVAVLPAGKGSIIDEATPGPAHGAVR